MTTLSISMLILLVIAFAVMGCLSILMPLRVTQQFGISELSRDGRSEVRAVYGGFGLAMAVALIMALLQPEWRHGICLTIGLALAGMVSGRLVSALLDRGIGRFPLIYLFVELIGAAMLFYIVRQA